MESTTINGVELAYEEHGEGEPMLIIHGAIWADFLRPLATQPALGGFRNIRYHRRGYGVSSEPAGDLDAQAADAVALLDQLEVDRAHLVGHSLGAMIALVFGSAYPDRVRSMALLEPLPPNSWTAASDFADLLEPFGSAVEASVGRYQAGDIEGALDGLFTPQGLDWRAAAEAAGPGVADQGIRDAAAFFDTELPAMAEWSFGPDEASAIDCPVLSWHAGPDGRWTHAIQAFLHEMFPQCEDADLEGGDHFSPQTDPAAVAEAITEFISRHSRAGAAT